MTLSPFVVSQGFLGEVTIATVGEVLASNRVGQGMSLPPLQRCLLTSSLSQSPSPATLRSRPTTSPSRARSSSNSQQTNSLDPRLPHHSPSPFLSPSQQALATTPPTPIQTALILLLLTVLHNQLLPAPLANSNSSSNTHLNPTLPLVHLPLRFAEHSPQLGDKMAKGVKNLSSSDPSASEIVQAAYIGR